MSDKIVQLTSKGKDTTELLGIIDKLRAAVESGEIIGVIAVGVEPNHNTQMFSGCVTYTSRLVMMGALAHLKHCFHDGA